MRSALHFAKRGSVRGEARRDFPLTTNYPKDTLVTGSEEFSDNALICFVPDDLKNEIKHLWSIPNDGYNPRVRALKKTQSFFKEKGFELSIKKAESIMKKIRES